MHGPYGGRLGRLESDHGPGGSGFGLPERQENSHDSDGKGAEQGHGKFTALVHCESFFVLWLFQPLILRNMRTKVAKIPLLG